VPGRLGVGGCYPAPSSRVPHCRSRKATRDHAATAYLRSSSFHRELMMKWVVDLWDYSCYFGRKRGCWGISEQGSEADDNSACVLIYSIAGVCLWVVGCGARRGIRLIEIFQLFLEFHDLRFTLPEPGEKYGLVWKKLRLSFEIRAT